MSDDLTSRSQQVLARLSPPRRHRLARMLHVEQLYGTDRAGWIAEGASAWKMARALEDDRLIRKRPNVGYMLTPLGTRVAQIYDETRTKPETP